MFDRVLDPLTRDFNELVNGGPVGWAILAVLVLLPALAIVLLFLGSRLAITPLAIYAAIWLELIIYYATGYRSNLGLGFEMLIRALPMLVAWVLLAVAALRVIVRRRARAAAPRLARRV
jgi:hypothetical protein